MRHPTAVLSLSFSLSLSLSPYLSIYLSTSYLSIYLCRCVCVWFFVFFLLVCVSLLPPCLKRSVDLALVIISLPGAVGPRWRRLAWVLSIAIFAGARHNNLFFLCPSQRR